MNLNGGSSPLTAHTIDMTRPGLFFVDGYRIEVFPTRLPSNPQKTDSPQNQLANVIEGSRVQRTAFRQAVGSSAHYFAARVKPLPYETVFFPQSPEETLHLLKAAAPDVVAGRADHRSYLAPLLTHPDLGQLLEALYDEPGIGSARNLLEVFWPEMRYRYVTQDPEHHGDRTIQQEMFHLLQKCEDYISMMEISDPELFAEFRNVLRFALLFLCYGKHDGKETDEDGRLVAVEEGARKILPNGKIGFTGYDARTSCFVHLMTRLNEGAPLNERERLLVAYLIEHHFKPISFITGSKGGVSSRTAKNFLKEFCYMKTSLLKVGVPPLVLLKLLRHTVAVHQYGMDPRHTKAKAAFRESMDRFFAMMEGQLPLMESEILQDENEKRSPLVREIRVALASMIRSRYGEEKMQRVFPEVKRRVMAFCREGQVTTVAQALSVGEELLVEFFPELTPMAEGDRKDLLSSVRPAVSSMRLSSIGSERITTALGIVCEVTRYRMNPRPDLFSHHDADMMKNQVESGRYPRLAHALAEGRLTVEKIIEAMTKGFVNLTDLELWISEALNPSVCIDLVGHGAGATMPYMIVERPLPNGLKIKITMRRGFQGSVEHVGEGWIHGSAQRGEDAADELRNADDFHAKLSQASDDVGIGVLTSDFCVVPADVAGRSFIFGRTKHGKFGTVLVDEISQTEWRVRTMMAVGRKRGLRERLKTQLGRLLGRLSRNEKPDDAIREHPQFISVLEDVNRFCAREGVAVFSNEEVSPKIRNPLNAVVIKDFIKQRLARYAEEEGVPPSQLSRLIEPLFAHVSSQATDYIGARDRVVSKEGPFQIEMERLASPILERAKKRAETREELALEGEIRVILIERIDFDNVNIRRALETIRSLRAHGTLTTRDEVINYARVIQIT